MGQLPSGPPAILSPTAVHVARGLEDVTASAVSQDTGIIAPLAARVSYLPVHSRADNLT